MSPIEINANILSRIDAVPNPAHVPDCLSKNIVPLDFWQRLEELWSLLKSEYFYFRWVIIPIGFDNSLVYGNRFSFLHKFKVEEHNVRNGYRLWEWVIGVQYFFNFWLEIDKFKLDFFY